MSPLFEEVDGPRPLEPAIRTVWRIKMGLFWIVVFAVTATYEIASLFGEGGILPFGVLSTVTLLVGTAAVVVQPSLRYRFWRYDLRADELFLERGILNRVRTIVPLRRIQHLDVSQDVLEREFDLGKLIVHTAGARSSEVVLPGLLYGTAEELREKMKQYILEDVV